MSEHIVVHGSVNFLPGYGNAARAPLSFAADFQTRISASPNLREATRCSPEANVVVFCEVVDRGAQPGAQKGVE